ncbi:MAG TPA: VTT domain-containing protein [Chitinophagaceae bacterium]|jgi:membrane-associated protein|nr:VTT domain-containing protein [Chitinophagaceae bacterium]HMU57961.1 VTT domain-containing protein [Chitinophagaceae bacterium]
MAMELMYLLDSFHWSQLLQPQWYIENGGLWLLLFVVFAETGLFVGFFLPGDSLLFVAGIYAHEITKKGEAPAPGLGYQFLKHFGFDYPYTYWLDLFVLVGLISLMGILGNTVGYWTGRKVGPAMYHWRDRLLFKKKYLHQAHDFYEKHGGLAVIGARFLPFIRTFAPIVAGIVEMDRKKFHFFNVVGCIAWVATMILGGFFLQKWVLQQFNFDLKEHLEIIVIGIVVVTTAPVLIKMFAPSKKKPQENNPQ